MTSKLPAFFRFYRRALVLLALAAMLFCAAAGIFAVIDRFGGIGGLCAQLFTGKAPWEEDSAERAPLDVEKEIERDYI